MERIKRIAKYLKGRPRYRCGMRFEKIREEDRGIAMYTDSDWAGREDQRKSVSGGFMALDGMWLRSWSKDQTKIARSSGEAELYAVNYGCSQALGVLAILKEVGWEEKLVAKVDANATIGTLR